MSTEEAKVVRLRARSTFLTRTAEQFGVGRRGYVVGAGKAGPSITEMQSDLVTDIGEHLHPEDGE